MKIITFFVCMVLLCACGKQTAVEKALDEAGDNRLELLKVIDHYRNSEARDSLKLEAAMFLIGNMPGHGSVWSEAIDTFRQELCRKDIAWGMEAMNRTWDALKANDKPVFRKDLNYMKADFLIENIDKAFQTWQASAWKDEVDFDLFCNYVLPYRFETELLAKGWRDSLYQEFSPAIKNVKTLKEAFEAVHDTVWKRVRSSSSHFPHIVDVVAMRNQQKAMCIQRCVMLGAVMRALGIPAAIDNVGRWANYSSNGHAMTVLVTREGSYSIFSKEKEAKRKNRIDATLFEVNYPLADNYPLKTDFKKRAAKVWRSTYKHQPVDKEADKDWDAARPLVSPFREDVSAEYGLEASVNVETTLPVERAYLCTFGTGKDWMPIAFAKPKNGICRFEALGDSVVYAVIANHEGKLTALEPPFILANGRKVSLVPDKAHTETVTLTRKYPLTGKWMNEWAPMPGGRFEGSNDADFNRTETLGVIDSMPVFRNIIKVNNPKPFCYVRYVSEQTCDTPMAEVELYNKEGKLKPVPGKSSVAHVERSLDGNTLTRPDIDPGYSLGYDLGEATALDSIVFFPWNDDNFVLPGHAYELFYYDGGWVSAGKRVSEGWQLVYEGVPTHALLYLRDHTAGKEERPFTYEQGKQVWW